MHDLEQSKIDPPFTPGYSQYEDFEVTIQGMTRRLFQTRSQIRNESGTDFMPRTNLGRIIKSVIESDASLTAGNDGCCHEAEVKLLESIKTENVQKPQFRSPLIVVDEDRPVAVVKPYGERTGYGLESREDKGIIEGAFASTSLRRIVNELPRVPHAWQINITETEPFQPVKLSTMLTSKEARSWLWYEAYDARTSDYDHADIVRQVNELLPDAAPVDGSGHYSL